MAFFKTASAKICTPRASLDSWVKLQGITKSAARSKSNLITSIDPNRYLLTHATIISSVDTEEAPNVKVGSSPIQENGRNILRPWNDYLIVPSTAKYVNANDDCWERKLLLATYKTFVGAENYLEHVQIPELSKGKIIDAVARNLDDTVYVDILVATDRVHTQLIDDILNKRINSMSMGCTIQYSLCTKCGNKAHDETELCDHVKYSKGTMFYDGEAQRKIAELCGHYTDPESVRFIEASWVGEPAFAGAVARNFLNEDFNQIETSGPIEEVLRRAYRITEQQAPSLNSMSSMDLFFKEASRSLTRAISAPMQRQGFDFDEGGEEGSEEQAPQETFLEKLKKDTVKDIKDQIRRQVQKDINDEMLPKEKATNTPAMPEAEAAPNDSIIQSSKKKALVKEMDRIAALYTLKTASAHPDRMKFQRILTASLVALELKGNCHDLFVKASAEWKPAITEAIKIRDTLRLGKQLSIDYSLLTKVANHDVNDKNLIRLLKAGLGRTPSLKEVEFYKKRLAMLIPF